MPFIRCFYPKWLIVVLAYIFTWAAPAGIRPKNVVRVRTEIERNGRETHLVVGFFCCCQFPLAAPPLSPCDIKHLLPPWAPPAPTGLTHPSMDLLLLPAGTHVLSVSPSLPVSVVSVSSVSVCSSLLFWIRMSFRSKITFRRKNRDKNRRVRNDFNRLSVVCMPSLFLFLYLSSYLYFCLFISLFSAVLYLCDFIALGFLFLSVAPVDPVWSSP